MDTVTDPDPGRTPEPEQPTVADIDAIDARLDEVERSLARIDAGTYGRCEACGALIDDASLTADPTTVRCDSCRPPEAGAGPDVDPGPGVADRGADPAAHPAEHPPATA
jgi:hypothetical protein